MSGPDSTENPRSPQRKCAILHGIASLLVIFFTFSLPCTAQVTGDPFAEESVIPQAPPPPQPISGYLETRNQFSLKEDPISLRQRLQLEARYHRDRLKGYLTLRGDYDLAAGMDDKDALDAEMDQATLTIKGERIEVLVGKTIIRWGTGDGVNPMDLINPVDVKDPLCGARSDSRESVWLVNTTVDFRAFHLDLVWLPRGEVAGIPEDGSPWEGHWEPINRSVSQGALVLDTGHGPDWFADHEMAAKLITHARGIDLEFIYFNGFSDAPVLSPKPGTAPMVSEVIFPRFQAVGMAFATGFGKTTLRGEAAMKHGLEFNRQADGKPEERDFYQGVLGWDYTANDNTYINIQWFGSLIQRGDQPLKANRFSHGLTYELSRPFRDDALKAGLRGTAFISHEGCSIEAFGEYKWGDHLNMDTGFIWFSGPGDTALGQYRDNDMFYFKLKHFF